jgi:drug/metabolite transporter (DMT)-like permease
MRTDTRIAASPATTQAESNLRSLAVLAMLGSVAIYGSNFAISRYAVLHQSFSPYDLVALRFIVAGLLLLPIFVRAGVRTCAGIGWGRGVLLAIIGGFPMSLLMLSGLALAPAAHGAAIGPGTVTLIGVIGSWLWFGNRLGRMKIAGLGIVLVGLGCIGWTGASLGDPRVVLGDLLFLATGLVWGAFPLLVQRWNLDPLTSTAVVAVLSLAFLPFYALFLEPRLAALPWDAVVLHAFNQGVLNIIVALWLWSWAVGVIGAGMTGRFPPLIPVIGTLAAVPLLGEVPGLLQMAGIALIVTGLLWVALARR